MTLISIEGNIGSGKSTILKQLKKYSDDFVYVDEPVSQWESIKDSNDKNILELFYQDQKKYSFSFQILAYITRLKSLLDAYKSYPHKIIICERSIYTDKYVFAKMLYEQGNIEEIEWKTYNYWFDTFNELTKLDGLIYVNTDPQTCFDRIKKRNRSGESDIPLEYLKNCDEKHRNWIDNTEIKKIIINGNDEFENDFTKRSLIIESCLSFSKQLFSSGAESSFASS
jgi:deoxyadenosine/deoxycytidine kinase